MDPIANIERQRELVKTILEWPSGKGQSARAQAAIELAETRRSESS